VASSRESGSLPFQVARELQKLRKRGVTLSYTAPSFARTERIIREVTRGLTFCQGRMPVRDTDIAGVRAWRRNRLLRWITYDAQELEKFTSTEREEGKKSEGRVRVVDRQTFRVSGSLAALAFESEDEVLSLGWASEAGVCLECGGRRPIPKCSCGVSHGLGDDGPPAGGGAARTGRHGQGVSVPLIPLDSA
jgi:hypothetical protein